MELPPQSAVQVKVIAESHSKQMPRAPSHDLVSCNDACNRACTATGHAAIAGGRGIASANGTESQSVISIENLSTTPDSPVEMFDFESAHKIKKKIVIKKEAHPPGQHYQIYNTKAKNKRGGGGRGILQGGYSPTTRVSLRRLAIEEKMRNFAVPRFTALEEFDIHERAEAFATSILPDPHFFIPPEGDQAPLASYHFAIHRNRKKVQRKSLASSKRGRQSYSNMDGFVTGWGAFGDNYILPEGTRLLKPPKKLVELVAQAIDGSPDGLLQVQQVYQVLMNRYPYFKFMDKTSMTSWRSSVRHALYQKWFRKLQLRSETIRCKGCYWAISGTQYTPREWALPAAEENGVERFPTEDFFASLGYASSEDTTSTCSPSYEHDKPETQSLLDHEQTVRFSQDSEDLSCLSAPSATYNNKKPGDDPDPVLTTSIGGRSIMKKRDKTMGPSTPRSEPGSSGDSTEQRSPSSPGVHQLSMSPVSPSQSDVTEPVYGAWWEEYYQLRILPPNWMTGSPNINEQ